MAQHVPADLPVLRVLTEHEIIFSNYRSAFERETQLWRKCVKCYDWLVQLNYEARVCRNFHRIACMTDEDRVILSRFVEPSRLRTVPIGVDSSYFDPQQVPAEESSRRMLFVGNYRHPPNSDAIHFFVREVLPLHPAGDPGRRVLHCRQQCATAEPASRGGGRWRSSGWVCSGHSIVLPQRRPVCGADSNRHGNAGEITRSSVDGNGRRSHTSWRRKDFAQRTAKRC